MFLPLSYNIYQNIFLKKKKKPKSDIFRCVLKRTFNVINIKNTKF